MWRMAPTGGHEDSTVFLPIRKINPLRQMIPSPITGSKTFGFSKNAPLSMEVVLEKSVYMHGEPIGTTPPGLSSK